MHHLSEQLQRELAARENDAMLRQLRAVQADGAYVSLDGRRLVNLASNDYLGLSQHPRLKQAAAAAIEAHGTGTGASRLIVGHFDLHAQVERAFAAFKHAEAALLLPTGYMANLAVLTALAGPGDLVCLDKLNHASLIDAARASGAQVRTFAHLSYEKLERQLARDAQKSPPRHGRFSAREVTAPTPTPCPPRRFIVTDSIFSMDGDAADLVALCDLAERYDAILVVDEAHATGVLGDTGAGLCEAQGVADRVDIVMSTASKALGGLGGIITGTQAVIDTLINTARPMIYTTGAPPAQVAAIGAALDLVRDEPWRRARVTELAARLREELRADGWTLPASSVATPILPLIVGDAAKALELAAHLRDAGFFAVAIRPPTVPPGAARVRLSVRADLKDDDLSALRAAIQRWPG